MDIDGKIEKLKREATHIETLSSRPVGDWLAATIDKERKMDSKTQSELTKLAADLVLGRNLVVLSDICEGQKTVSTRKLSRAVEELHDREKLIGIRLRQIADKLQSG